jgi:hypothetical protein
MSYFTQRHGMRTPIEPTSIISSEMYALLFSCCEKYYNNIAWMWPDECSDGLGCCGLAYAKFDSNIKFEIPTLYRDYNGNIGAPNSVRNGFGNDELEYDQYALLDLIEFFAQNSKDVYIGDFHSYWRHHHLSLLETRKVFDAFRAEINSIFEKTGLLFTLTANKIVERVVENSTLSMDTETLIQRVSEQGTRELLEEAIMLFKTPRPSARRDSVEKIWDALERLKTYYTSLDKKASVTKVVNDMSNGQADFITLFNSDFKALTDIGNNFRIRHHETNKVDITDNRHYDYFFNRCFSLIALAIQYLH